MKTLVKAIFACAFGAAVTFGLLRSFSDGSGLFRKRSQAVPDLNPEPLPYETVGNFPPLEDGVNASTHDQEYTLELGACDTKTCIHKTLHSLSQKGVEAFYTPSKQDGKLLFHIRRGIFNSRQTAQRAQASLKKEKKIKSEVVEL